MTEQPRRILADNKRVAVLPWPGIDDAFLILSGGWRDKERTGTRANITFCVRSGNDYIEWDGDYGPITLMNINNESDRGHWWQHLVDELELPKSFAQGDYEYIFNILRSLLPGNQ